jgi:hypothetical protein
MKWVYYNVNPLGERLPDCVIRAISLATNTDYYEILWLLEDIGDIFNCDELCVDCYSNLLTKVFGFELNDGESKAVSDIGERHPDDILIVRIKGHLTCVINNILFDIWDCSSEICDRYWIVKR